MGDPIRALQSARQISIIKSESLVRSTANVGCQLYSDLNSLAKSKGRGKMTNLRGKNTGTFIAWDMPNPESRDRFLKEMRGRGVNMAGVSTSRSVWKVLGKC